MVFKKYTTLIGIYYNYTHTHKHTHTHTHTHTHIYIYIYIYIYISSKRKPFLEHKNRYTDIYNLKTIQHHQSFFFTLKRSTNLKKKVLCD